jgi:hypothetical protein
MSNWEARSLSRGQVKYAALDVLVAGQVFRGLRLWHSSPSPCASCLLPLGAVLVGSGAQGHPGSGSPAAAAAEAAAAGGGGGGGAPAPAAGAAEPAAAAGDASPAGERPFACTASGCGRAFSDAKAYLNHCGVAGHAPAWAFCDACGRMHPLGRRGG